MKGLLELLVVVLLCICGASALIYSNGAEHINLEDAEALFTQHMLTYHKVYNRLAFAEKFANFKASIERVNERNSKSQSAIFGLTKFADMSPEEFKETMLLSNPQEINSVHDSPQKLVADAPTSWDWRDKNAVTKVKDQKEQQCNAGWAFAPVEALESASIIAGNLPAGEWLSTQQVVDCDPFADACGGGLPNATYMYIMQAGGLESDADYPYEARDDGNCSFNASKVVSRMKSYEMNISLLHPNEEQLQRSVLNLGPVAVAVDASSWQDYKSGVMSAFDCAIINFLTHAAQVVGYNATTSYSSPSSSSHSYLSSPRSSLSVTKEASNTAYWIVRNSWGLDWGIDGYIYLEMWKDTCGLAHAVSWPIV